MPPYTERADRVASPGAVLRPLSRNVSFFRKGEILRAVEENGLKHRTVTYFASDHGGSLRARDSRGRLGGWNGVYRGKTGDAGLKRQGGGRPPSPATEGQRARRRRLLCQSVRSVEGDFGASATEHVLSRHNVRDAKIQALPLKDFHFNRRRKYE